MFAFLVLAAREKYGNNNFTVEAAFLTWITVSAVGLVRFTVLPSFEHQYQFFSNCIGGLALPLFALGSADSTLHITQTIVKFVPFLDFGACTLAVVVAGVLVAAHTVVHGNSYVRVGTVALTYGILMCMAFHQVTRGASLACILMLAFAEFVLKSQAEIGPFPGSVWASVLSGFCVLGIAFSFAN